MTRVCTKCKVPQPLEKFGRNKGTKDGLAIWCKDCTRRYRQSEEGKAARKRYRQSALGTASMNQCKKRWLQANQDKRKAHSVLAYAIRRGNIIPPETCSVPTCDAVPQAHHEDYSKPLEVVWLCHRHHKELHHREGEAG